MSQGFSPSGRLIFLLPPSLEHLRRRLMRRKTETAAAIRRRMSAARRELACAAWYDHRVVNDRLERAVGDITAIIGAERTTERGHAHGARTD